MRAVLIAFSVFLEASASASPSFEGYPCTEDCSGHQAGYVWAEEHGITSADNCGGNSQSFIEGCQAAAQATEQSADGEDNENEETQQ